MRNGQQKARKAERKTKNEMAEPAAELICPSAGRTIRNTVWIIVWALVFSAAVWGLDWLAVWVTGGIL